MTRNEINLLAKRNQKNCCLNSFWTQNAHKEEENYLEEVSFILLQLYMQYSSSAVVLLHVSTTKRTIVNMLISACLRNHCGFRPKTESNPQQVVEI